jgi:hypothetical protein
LDTNNRLFFLLSKNIINQSGELEKLLMGESLEKQFFLSPKSVFDIRTLPNRCWILKKTDKLK